MDAGGLIYDGSASPPPVLPPTPSHLTLREKLSRQIKLLPITVLHTWKVASTPFKLLVLLTTAVSVLLLLSEMKVRDLSRLNLRADDSAYVSSRRTASCTRHNPCNIHLVADLDTRSLVPGDKPKYISKLLHGKFHFGDAPGGRPHLEWGNAKKAVDVVGKLSEEGRGMELSELVYWRHQLLSFDDRTGVVYELVVDDGEGAVLSLPQYLRQKTLPPNTHIDAIPRYILSEEQDSSKGMKIEWACEKDQALYVGSFGKEYTTRDGSKITGESNFWIARISEDGNDIERLNWKSQYGRLREITGTQYPGYLIHEAVNWSEIRKKWYFLPRRESKEHYDEKKDEQRGSNLIIEIDSDFDQFKLVRVKFPTPVAPARGFSSFKFLPGTDDKLIVAIRSEEDDDKGILKTHLSIIDVTTGDLVMQEVEASDQYKFEGIEVW